MPFYRYVCENCNSQKTVFHSINEDPEIFCECGKQMKRAISRVGIIFKGSGFYSTDSRKNGVQSSESSSESKKKSEEKVA
ncbi:MULTISPECIES: FmdB family zinc ribbon protein [Pseudothermotoga]|jgi:putative FmdB family regulatory protein|uniref:Putative regulatory protein, FmdB family n=1 Tax=Pseudothermotoga lettingae (strain ATCC BAA-301 / DSM 14385 / NBRC 107922 / TMO) TaxID=416591 RepID=A8F3L5_PSELT|nr:MULTISPECIES: FmdB family zinc ribbon protein [Pseudothermotoga]ABV32749.1 putative regulatory protein, FmdB family [Pseudothermotoga lettingae TMO]KUK20186.1 MAG: Putative regulatory protein, FmdB family [Pseudothermotoga lettingae]MDK2885243.1 hypothetical protein [Pseudothermotoga sp.]GLI48257.1 hypothetical protein PLETTINGATMO_04260 [Pseudothermotoga lettingae TMO]HBJ80484.1 FmdB family transcriptional regulator [Pseudothermotoga sp.]